MAENKGGRPSIYTPELADSICRRMCEGESLRSICQESNMPDKSTVLLWVVQDREGFSHQYAQAMSVRAMQWADETVEIADAEGRDWRVDDSGNLIVEGEHIQRSKLRVDTRKWMISKLLPKVYGDRLALTGRDGGPIEHKEVADLSDEDLVRRAQQTANRVVALSTNGNGRK